MSSESKKSLYFEITFREDEMFTACEVYQMFERDDEIICDDFGPCEDVEWSEMEDEGSEISFSFTIKNPEKKESIISKLYQWWGNQIYSITDEEGVWVETQSSDDL